jgi:uncharacterized protein YjbI with pentapeptide repeats
MSTRVPLTLDWAASRPGMMRLTMSLTRGKIFLSYRRGDTAGAAAFLYDRLAAHFGHEQVFKDIDSLRPGDNFPGEIASTVASCDVLLAVIGQRWLTITDQHGARRLDDPGDFVRLEIETALAQDDVLVVPVLVDGARMPRDDELPASLIGLASRHARPLNASRFDAHVEKLLKALAEHLSTGGPDRPELSEDQRGAAAGMLLARAAQQIGSQAKALRKMGVETLKVIVAQWPHSPEAQAVPEMLAGLIIDHAPWTPDKQAALARALNNERTWTQPWPTTSGELPLPPWIAELPSLNARSPDVLAALELICRIASERPLELTLDEVDLRRLSLGEGREVTKLRGVRFNNAHFEGSYLVRVDLSTSQLSGAHFEGAVLIKCLLPLELRNGRFDRAELEDCRFPRPPFAAGASFRRTFFKGADLHDGVLNRADLRQASLVGANLQRASLQEASLEDANLSHANLTRCDLRAARLQRAELDGARLDDAILDGADLTGAHASPETTWPAGFDWSAAGVQLRSESFEEMARRKLLGG